MHGGHHCIVFAQIRVDADAVSRDLLVHLVSGALDIDITTMRA